MQSSLAPKEPDQPAVHGNKESALEAWKAQRVFDTDVFIGQVATMTFKYRIPGHFEAGEQLGRFEKTCNGWSSYAIQNSGCPKFASVARDVVANSYCCYETPLQLLDWLREDVSNPTFLSFEYAAEGDWPPAVGGTETLVRHDLGKARGENLVDVTWNA